MEITENPFKDLVMTGKNEFVLEHADGQREIVQIFRAQDNVVEPGNIANKASMGLLVEGINMSQAYAMLTTTIADKYDGDYSIFSEAQINGNITTVSTADGFKGIVVPPGITKVRIKAGGALQHRFDNVATGSVGHDLVINGVKYPVRWYDNGSNYNGNYISKDVVDEDKMYTVKGGDIIGLCYTKQSSGPGEGAAILHPLSKLIVEVLV